WDRKRRHWHHAPMPHLDRYQKALAALGSTSQSAVKEAYELALAAMAHHRPARRLAAQLFDRLRVLEGRPQKFGTQQSLDGVAWPVDLNTTDSERAKWDLPSLAELSRVPPPV
ncbi:MAG: hypothetical protein WCR59_05675, partial [Planctomycetota bacterium]